MREEVGTDTLGRAVAFVEANGSPVELARLRYLQTREAPSDRIVEELFAGRQEDGGWSPFWSPGYSSIDATCYRLTQAEQLALLDHPTAHGAGDFLRLRQHGDGCWEEESSVAEMAPSWATPGDPAATLYLTANAGYWQALLGNRESAERAAGFLSDAAGPNGTMASFPHVHWLAAGLFFLTGDQAKRGALTGYLVERAVPEASPSTLAWLGVTLLAAGDRENPALHGAATRLVSLQESDGRWVSEDGPARDVHATLEAIRVLKAEI